MKKNDMIKKNLEIKGLEEGVKWEDKAWLLQDLKDTKNAMTRQTQRADYNHYNIN